jgi:hypothetical protein
MSIDIIEAREIAEQSAFRCLDMYRKDKSLSLLMEDYVEAKNCWFFFRNREIYGPPSNNIWWGCDYMVSKKGNLAHIFDFYDDKERLMSYLQEYSDHLEKTGE